ncbi:uncharacterized protein isoform X2 [Musca autumnalis]|uniref:uncharacterized protein isoform X2 n=1 Tax=Musca autumnalis TaxID=221902 RepID=UPI003CEE5886
MDFTVVKNKEELCKLVVCELKLLGVKCFKEKSKTPQKKLSSKKGIFRTPLHLLELCDVILANGSVVQIPKFVADATNRILEQVETEGLFRKAGSSLRQREIRIILENGMPLGRSHHVIDVANVIKYFFRELPEPLIPTFLQDTMLRALLIGEQNEKAIILSCLLLPTLTINTLRFFMQFLHTVSLSESVNKMSTVNLAIILTPGIMPFGDINSRRFINHLKVVKILIENANTIGIVPIDIGNKLQIKANPESEITTSISSANSIDKIANIQKKIKRRSDMFNGFKRMVGSTNGSSEELERNIQKCTNVVPESQISDLIIIPSTPCNKSRKKRRFAEPMSAFSLKKKRDLLALLPNNSGGFLPNTPITKKTLKHRTSLSSQKNGNSHHQICVSPIQRRWSIVVGPNWHKTQFGGGLLNQQHENTSIHYNINQLERNIDDLITGHCNQQKAEQIETNPLKQSKNGLEEKSVINEIENIQKHYERILKETESLSIHNSNILDCEQKHLRRSCTLDSRSPSARKIGSIRRRCRETTAIKQRDSFVSNNTDMPDKNNIGSRVHLKRTRRSVGSTCNFPETHKKFIEEKTLSENSHTWIPGEHFFKCPFDEKNNAEEKAASNEECAGIIGTRRDFSEKSVTNAASSTQLIKQRTAKKAPPSNVPLVSRIKMSGTINNDDSGRASINRLRTDNAGMVIAKAKLFDQMGTFNDRKNQEIDYSKTKRLTGSVDSGCKTTKTKTVTMPDECIIPRNFLNKKYQE